MDKTRTDLDTVFRLFPVTEVSIVGFVIHLTINVCDLYRKIQESSLNLMQGSIILILKPG